MSDAAPVVAPVSAQAETPKADAAPDAKQSQTPVIDDPEFDFGDGLKLKRSEAANRLKKSKEIERGANEKFQTAAQMRKEADELVGLLSKDVKAALRKSGKDPIQVAEEILQEALQEHSLTPEQRRLRDAEAERDRLKQERAEREEAEKQTQAQAQVQQFEQHFDRMFTDVIKRKNLIADEDTLFRLASKVESYWGNGVEITIDDIADEVAEEMDALWNRKLTVSDDAMFAKLLGKVGLERAQKMLIAQATKVSAPQPQRNVQRPSGKAGERKPLSRAEFEERIAQRIR